MRKDSRFLKTVICVNEECFGDSLSAGRYFLELASHGQKVSVSRHMEEEAVVSEQDDEGLRLRLL